MKKVVALTIAGAAAALVAGWRRVQRDNAIDHPHGTGPSTGTPVPEPATAPEPSGKASEPPAAGGRPDPGDDATKAELYELAQELDIDGRSKMSKAELLRAIREAD